MLRIRQRFDKYRIEKRLGEGGFATIYQAYDSIEGIRVALKIPHQEMVSDSLLKDFKNEVRVLARLDHPHILPLKYASFIENRFVIVTPLGEQTLCDRLRKRMSFDLTLEFAQQMIEAVAFAHEHRVMHCDIKPENMILFENNHLRLADFGIAKIAVRTVRSSGSGTLGYMAPEQAMGKPSFRSDVFSLGLIIYRMLAGKWPEWPYEWPLPGHNRLKQKVPQEFVEFLKKSLQVNPKKRFTDAQQMLKQFPRLKRQALKQAAIKRTKKTTKRGSTTRKAKSKSNGVRAVRRIA
ncbi:Serine/threonine-protein kinase PrkC [Polystyrenella longa]|uniref:Serine/threonine-protein kinase PrkC n=2 Tax=Polystyrenella longa TaxID=2528007 RepID=A0A518CGN7_9PLAN|nr:Serine/threonine-protein kinase PrkC [Polystyrenella longa]